MLFFLAVCVGFHPPVAAPFGFPFLSLLFVSFPVHLLRFSAPAALVLPFIVHSFFVLSFTFNSFRFLAAPRCSFWLMTTLIADIKWQAPESNRSQKPRNQKQNEPQRLPIFCHISFWYVLVWILKDLPDNATNYEICGFPHLHFELIKRTKMQFRWRKWESQGCQGKWVHAGEGSW